MLERGRGHGCEGVEDGEVDAAGSPGSIQNADKDRAGTRYTY